MALNDLLYDVATSLTALLILLGAWFGFRAFVKRGDR
jgi:hypothetical protein